MRNLTHFGAFIEIEDGIDGLVHVSNPSWTKRVKHPSEIVKKGEKVRLSFSALSRRTASRWASSSCSRGESFFATHRVGDVVHGKILRTAQFGCFVEIAEGVEGLAGATVDGHSPLEGVWKTNSRSSRCNVEEKKVGLSLRTVLSSRK